MREDQEATLQEALETACNALLQADSAVDAAERLEERVKSLEAALVDQWWPEGLSANVQSLVRHQIDLERQLAKHDRWMDSHHELLMKLSGSEQD